jgi:tyrosine-protein kinase Etk/Wzc
MSGPFTRPDVNDASAFRLIDVIETFVAHGKRIVLWTLGVAVATALVTLIVPSWYRAVTTIFSPEEISESRRFLSNLSSLAIPGVRPKVGAQSPETFVAILESRRLRERVIERLGLVEALRARDVQGCLRKLEKRITVEIDNNSVIRVHVDDTDKERAAAIANAMVEELDKINVELRIYRSRRARQYLEEQLVAARTRLEVLEDSLRAFQEANLVIAIPEQSRAAVEVAAELEAKAIELRIRRGLIASYSTGENPELQTIEREIAQVESQIRTLARGSGEELSLARLPLLGVRYAQIFRDIKIGETLIALLTDDFEQARLDEAKETPIVQVLDVAVSPEKRHRPKRKLIVASVTAAAFLILTVAHVAIERYRAVADASDRRRWAAIAEQGLRWLPGPLRR